MDRKLVIDFAGIAHRKNYVRVFVGGCLLDLPDLYENPAAPLEVEVSGDDVQIQYGYGPADGVAPSWMAPQRVDLQQEVAYVSGLGAVKIVAMAGSDPLPTTAQAVLKPTTVFVEPTTVFVEPTTVFVEPTTVFVEPTTVFVEPTTVFVEPNTSGESGLGG